MTSLGREISLFLLIIGLVSNPHLLAKAQPFHQAKEFFTQKAIHYYQEHKNSMGCLVASSL